MTTPPPPDHNQRNAGALGVERIDLYDMLAFLTAYSITLDGSGLTMTQKRIAELRDKYGPQLDT